MNKMVFWHRFSLNTLIILLSLFVFLPWSGCSYVSNPWLGITNEYDTNIYELTMIEKDDEYIDNLFWDPMISNFNTNHPRIHVTRRHTNVNDIVSVFHDDFMKGDAPEIIITPSDKIGVLADSNLIVSISEFYPEILDRIEEDISTYTKMNNTFWGVPIAVGNVLSLLYNKNYITNEIDHFTNLFDLTNQLSNDQYVLVFPESTPFWGIPFYTGFGGDVFDSTGVNPNLDNEAMKNALQFIYNLKYQYGVIPEYLLSTNILNSTNTNIQTNYQIGYSEAETLFIEGKAAALINGVWAWQYYETILTNFEWGICPIPKIPDAGYPMPYIGAVSANVSADVMDLEQDKAWAVKEFLRYLLFYTNQINYAKITSQVPATKEAQLENAIEDDPFINATVKQMQYGLAMPVNRELDSIWAAVNQEIPLVIYSNKSPSNACADMQDTAETLIEEMQ